MSSFRTPSSSTRSGGGMLPKDAPRSDGTTPNQPSTSCWSCCCGGSSVVDSVVEFASTQAATQLGSLRASPPLMLVPGYANEEGEARGTAPPACGHFEVVNKTKYDSEIIGVLVSPIAAQLGLKRQRDVLGHMEYLRGGCMPAQTVMHASFGQDIDVLEVALFFGCKHPSVDALTTVPNVADAFEHVKGYRVRCTGRNVLLKYKDGVGLEPQKGEAASLLPGFGRKKKSVGGRIDMRTNVQVIELVQ